MKNVIIRVFLSDFDSNIAVNSCQNTGRPRKHSTDLINRTSFKNSIKGLLHNQTKTIAKSDFFGLWSRFPDQNKMNLIKKDPGGCLWGLPTLSKNMSSEKIPFIKKSCPKSSYNHISFD